LFLLLRYLRQGLPSVASAEPFFPTGDVQADNKWRAERADRFIAEHIPRSVPFSDRLLVMVIASGRPHRYLTQVMAHLLMNNGSNVSYEICDVTRSGESNVEAMALHHLAHVIRVEESLFTQNRTDDIAERVRREARDYARCLRAAIDQGRGNRTPSYVLMLEDDALPVDSFFSLLESVMGQMDARREVDYVKLYHPGPYRKCPYYFQLIIAAGLFCSIIHYMVWGWKAKVLGVIEFIYCIALLHSYTFQLMVDIRFSLTGSVYFVSGESCCTPAVLYRRESIDQLLHHFETEETSSDRAKDHILDESSLLGRMTDSNLIVHIGFYSTIRKGLVALELPPRSSSLWSFISQLFHIV